MTIDEIKSKKRELEDKLTQIVREFENEIGVECRTIYVSRYNYKTQKAYTNLGYTPFEKELPTIEVSLTIN